MLSLCVEASTCVLLVSGTFCHHCYALEIAVWTTGTTTRWHWWRERERVHDSNNVVTWLRYIRKDVSKKCWIGEKTKLNIHLVNNYNQVLTWLLYFGRKLPLVKIFRTSSTCYYSFFSSCILFLYSSSSSFSSLTKQLFLNLYLLIRTLIIVKLFLKRRHLSQGEVLFCVLLIMQIDTNFSYILRFKRLSADSSVASKCDIFGQDFAVFFDV